MPLTYLSPSILLLSHAEGSQGGRWVERPTKMSLLARLVVEPTSGVRIRGC
jgi:hypothetical protein